MPDLAALACSARVDRAFMRRARGRLLIVCYHGVSDGLLPHGCPEWHHVDVADFEKQIRWVARHFRILPIDEALSRLQAGTRERLAAITFDDGYLNNRTTALPVLRAIGAPATVYLATGLVDRGGLLWTVRLEAAIRLTGHARLDLSSLGLGERRLGDNASRKATAADAVRALKRLGPDQRHAVLPGLLDQTGVPEPRVLEPFRMLDWDGVAAMVDEGLMSFGAHTVNHEILSTLDDARLQAEISDSIAALQGRVERVSSTFAYPNGTRADFDERAVRILRDSTVTAALTTIEGLNDRDSDRFALKRLVVGREMSFDRFRLAASGASASVRTLLGRRAAIGG